MVLFGYQKHHSYYTHFNFVSEFGFSVLHLISVEFICIFVKISFVRIRNIEFAQAQAQFNKDIQMLTQKNERLEVNDIHIQNFSNFNKTAHAGPYHNLQVGVKHMSLRSRTDC